MNKNKLSLTAVGALLLQSTLWAGPIILPKDTIPNFGENPTIFSVTNGDWSNPSTWSPQRVPTTGDIVAISPATEVTYNMANSPRLNTVAVQNGGKLIFRTDINTKIWAATYLVMEGGEWRVGNSAIPVAGNVKAEIIVADEPLNLSFDPDQYGTGLIILGKFTAHGELKTPFEQMAEEGAMNATALLLKSAPLNWRANDRLFIPSSRSWYPSNQWLEWQAQDLTLTSVSGNNVSFNPALFEEHPAAKNHAGVIEDDMYPHIGNLTRNIVIKSENPDGTRGHAFFSHRADVDIRYVQFENMGRTTREQLDRVTNHIGRYAAHFHFLLGPVRSSSDQNDPNVYQFTFIGNSLSNTQETLHKWAIAIHGSHYGLIKDNVIYNWNGAGVSTEDASESFNVIDHNFVAKVKGTGGRLDHGLAGIFEGHGAPGSAGSGFYITGPNNIIRNNIVANVPYGQFYAYALFFLQSGIRRAPLFRGADPAIDGWQFNANNHPLLSFENNLAYASGRALTFWSLNAADSTELGGEAGVIKDFKAFHCGDIYVFGYPASKLTVDGLKLRGDRRYMRWSSQGYSSGDYFSANNVLKNADIQNLYSAFSGGNNSAASSVPDGVQIIKDSYFNNYADIATDTPVYSFPAKWGYPVNLIIQNVEFGNPEGIHLSRGYHFGDGRNLVVPDRMKVINYNKIPGNNFEVFYLEQKRDFIIPQSYSPERPNTLGSKEGGLTNEQNWLKYKGYVPGSDPGALRTDPNERGLAIAGAVTPCETTHPRVVGFVCPADINAPPLVNAGADKTLAFPADNIQLSGSASDDGLPTGNTLTYAWTQVSGPANVTFSQTDSLAVQVSFPLLGVYTLQLGVSDGDLTSRAQITITVQELTANNQRPSVSITSPRSVSVGQALSLNPTASDDGIPGPLQFEWLKVTGPGDVTFSDRSSANTSATFAAMGTHVLRVSVNDGELESAGDVTVTVSAQGSQSGPSGGNGPENLVADGKNGRNQIIFSCSEKPTLMTRAKIKFDMKALDVGVWAIDRDEMPSGVSSVQCKNENPKKVVVVK